MLKVFNEVSILCKLIWSKYYDKDGKEVKHLQTLTKVTKIKRF